MSCLTTHYVAATEKVFKYNHVVYLARFENGVAAEAVRIDVDYTVDLEIETSAIDLGDEEDDDAGIVRTLLSPPSDDGVPGLSAVATALPGMAPTAMFDISFSTPSLGKTTQLVIARDRRVGANLKAGRERPVRSHLGDLGANTRLVGGDRDDRIDGQQ